MQRNQRPARPSVTLRPNAKNAMLKILKSFSQRSRDRLERNDIFRSPSETCSQTRKVRCWKCWNHFLSGQGIGYTAKNYELLKTGLNNVVLPILFNVVNNIVQHCYTWLQAGFKLNNLFSIVDNIEQCGQHNIVQSCFQQPSTTLNFYACRAQSHLQIAE